MSLCFEGLPQAGSDPLEHLLRPCHGSRSGVGELVFQCQLCGCQIRYQGKSSAAAHSAARYRHDAQVQAEFRLGTGEPDDAENDRSYVLKT